MRHNTTCIVVLLALSLAASVSGSPGKELSGSVIISDEQPQTSHEEPPIVFHSDQSVNANDNKFSYKETNKPTSLYSIHSTETEYDIDNNGFPPVPQEDNFDANSYEPRYSHAFGYDELDQQDFHHWLSVSMEDEELIGLDFDYSNEDIHDSMIASTSKSASPPDITHEIGNISKVKLEENLSEIDMASPLKPNDQAHTFSGFFDRKLYFDGNLFGMKVQKIKGYNAKHSVLGLAVVFIFIVVVYRRRNRAAKKREELPFVVQQCHRNRENTGSLYKRNVTKGIRTAVVGDTIVTFSV